jgi:hypothetical protein
MMFVPNVCSFDKTLTDTGWAWAAKYKARKEMTIKMIFFI